MGRVNYVLRAIHISGGKHQVVLSFFPKSVNTTETLAYISLVILLLLVVAGVVLRIFRKKHQS